MNKIKRIRKRLDMTQGMLAKAIGVSQPSISRLEKQEKIPRTISLALDGLVEKHRKAKGNGASGV